MVSLVRLHADRRTSSRLRALLLSEIPVQALIRPGYQGGGCGCSRDAPVLPTPPPARILPGGRRPIRARLPPGSGCSPVQSTRSQRRESQQLTCRRRHRVGEHQHQRDERRAVRVWPRDACSLAHRLISGRSHSLTRPLPRSNTGRGMSLYRAWYWSTVLRYARPRISATPWVSIKSLVSTRTIGRAYIVTRIRPTRLVA
jgi:hypothetical protein